MKGRGVWYEVNMKLKHTTCLIFNTRGNSQSAHMRGQRSRKNSFSLADLQKLLGCSITVRFLTLHAQLQHTLLQENVAKFLITLI